MIPDSPEGCTPVVSDTNASRVQGNEMASAYPQQRCVHELFSEQAERTPDATALVYEQQQLTYRQLDERSNQLAHHLRQLGVGPEEVVGLCVERSIEMVVGLVGILKAGGAYLPLEPSYPAERLHFMLEDAAVKVLLTQQHLQEQRPEPLPEGSARRLCLDGDWPSIARQPTRAPPRSASAHTLAYVIYTSGSTGRPKGTLITHQSVTRLFAATQAWFAFD